MPRKLKTRWHIDDMSAQELADFLLRIGACEWSRSIYRGMTLAEAWNACDRPGHIEFLLDALSLSNSRKACMIAVGREGEYYGWPPDTIRRYKELIIIKPK